VDSLENNLVVMADDDISGSEDHSTPGITKLSKMDKSGVANFGTTCPCCTASG